MKACIVVPFYFKPRRIRSNYQTFSSVEDVLALAEYCVESYSQWDSGCETDIIFVNNSPEVKEASDYLKKINGKKSYSGKFIVIDGDNIGMSFGAHNLAYETFKDKYEYWFFTEDDMIINKPGLIKIAIEQMEEDSKIGFIACYGISHCSRNHVHGGVGCTSRKNLEKVYKKFGKLPFHNSIPDLKDNKKFKQTHITHGEIAFTNCYKELGMRLTLVKADNIPYMRWDENDSPHCDQRDIAAWGEKAKFARDKKFGENKKIKKKINKTPEEELKQIESTLHAGWKKMLAEVYHKPFHEIKEKLIKEGIMSTNNSHSEDRKNRNKIFLNEKKDE